MNVTLSLINNIFNHYNKVLFENEFGTKLPTPEFVLSGRAKKWLGQFNYLRKDRIGYSYKIKISKNFDFDKESLINVVVHEMLHEFIQFSEIHDTSVHGMQFNYYKNLINHKFPELNITVRDSSTKLKSKTNRVIIFYDFYKNKCILKTNSPVVIHWLIKNYGKYGNIYEGYSSSDVINKITSSVSRIHYLYFDRHNIEVTDERMLHNVNNTRVIGA